MRFCEVCRTIAVPSEAVLCLTSIQRLVSSGPGPHPSFEPCVGGLRRLAEGGAR